MSCENDIQFYFEYVLDLVRKAGMVLLEAQDIDVELKNNKHYDIVTQFDTKIEEVLIKEIQKKFPDHQFIGEESSAASDKRPVLTDEPTWIIDPIDGTSNFVRRIPITCISVGLVIDKVQILGIIYNPYMEEMFTAIRGQGAYLNGKRIRVSEETEMKKALFNYELSLAISKKKRDLYMRRLPYLLDNVCGIRSYGCAALSLCYVAQGLMDAYQCDGLYPWDAAAGTLIVQEAGGYICDSSKERLGEKMNLMHPNFLATSSEELAQEFIKWERIADETANN
ncbi:uncharacterized protein [Atheta coriaria]|uniref:uncharacterized protein n=1 Tax=Dalotia coriaria TaxID=877792 RepID=UPI0031F35FCC